MSEPPKRSRFRLPSPAMVVACIALAVALGGVGYAAVALPKGSVGTKQLKKNAVVGKKVRNGTLGGIDLANASVGPAKLRAFPAVHAYKDTQTSYPSGLFEAIAMNGTEFDTAGMWDPSDPSRLTVPRAGTYVVTASMAWATSDVGTRMVALYRNGSLIARDVIPSRGAPSHVVTAVRRLAKGDVLQIRARQDTGASLLSGICVARACPTFSAAWIGP